MRTDSQIELDVLDEMAGDPELDSARVGVAVVSGVVRLSGAMPTYAAKLAALRATERICGVRGVVDDIVVMPPRQLARSDADLASAIGALLALNVLIPPQTIRVSVSNGWATLDGAASHHTARTAAECSIATLPGLRGIVNRIVLAPKAAPPSTLVLGIEKALRRSAELDSKHILVEANPDGAVSLRGTVRSWAELHDAERAAWAAPGVRDVTNRLAVVL
jgi:osmotically-inducible protein OsmY